MDNTLIGLTPEQVKEFCQKHHIRFMAFFGSVVRDDFRPDSDLDVLVKFEPNHIPGFEFFLIEAELSQLTRRKVDLQTENFLSKEIRQTAVAEAVTVYEQA
jgi:hypothetical protein